MNFYKDTKSYEFISIIEKIPFCTPFQRLKNSVKYMIKYEIYEFLIKRKIHKKRISNEQIVNLYINLFKEYFYLQEMINKTNIKSNSRFTYTMIDNSIIDSSIVYNIHDGEYIIIEIQYDIITENYNIYINTSHANIDTLGFNVTEKNLKIFKIKDVVITLLGLLSTDILHMILELFKYYYDISKEE